jgi:type II secretory pathway pseudopilin PulG
MCDFGISALVVAAVAGIASTAVAVTSSVQQGKAQQAQANYQAAVNRNNAQIAQNNANLERQQGIEDARAHRIKTLANVGKQQAGMAANGLDITQGTALDVIEDTAAIGELDAMTAQWNQERKALSYEAQGNNFVNQANLDEFGGRNAYQAGVMGAISAGLSGLSSTAGSVASFGGGGLGGGTKAVAPKWAMHGTVA